MLDTTGYTIVDLPYGSPIPNLVERVVDDWVRFVRLPEEDKRKYKLPIFETDFSDPGHFQKRREEGDDRKQYFHHIGGIMKTLYDMVGVHELDPLLKAFLASADDLSQAMKEFILSLKDSDLFANPRGKEDFLSLIRSSLSLLTGRFLYYEPGKIGEVAAKDHVDKAGLAFSIYSSHYGLEIDGGYNGKPRKGRRSWTPLRIPSRSIAIWGGHQFCEWAKAAQVKGLQPLAHRVVPDNSESRASIVYFAQPFGVPRPSKDTKMTEVMSQYGY